MGSMFRLAAEEAARLRSQFVILDAGGRGQHRRTMGLRSQSVISSLGHGGRRYLPYAFTEQGVAMLSAVLKSDRAVEVNIGRVASNDTTWGARILVLASAA